MGGREGSELGGKRVSTGGQVTLDPYVSCPQVNTHAIVETVHGGSDSLKQMAKPGRQTQGRGQRQMGIISCQRGTE